MTGPFFIDTNLLVYWRDQLEPSKQAQAQEWVSYCVLEGNGVLSPQVLNEYYNTVTRKMRGQVPTDLARKDVESFLTWTVVPFDSALYEQAWQIQDRYSISGWDCFIIAAALLGKCKVLLSEDMQDGLQIGTMTIMNPFHVSPPS